MCSKWYVPFFVICSKWNVLLLECVKNEIEIAHHPALVRAFFKEKYWFD
jgi:hypothetical protein